MKFWDSSVAITFSTSDQASEFVCLDVRLAKAAKAEGMVVLPATSA